MALKRRATTYRRNAKRRRVTKRRTYRRRATTQKVFRIKRWANNLQTFTGNDTIPLGIFNATFQLSDIPNVTEITNLFDQYQITRVKYRFILRKDVTKATTSAKQGLFPLVTWVHDYDGANSNATADLRQYTSCRQYQFNQNRTQTPWYWIKPARLNLVYNGATSAYTPTWSGFLDCSYGNVPHYSVAGRYDELYLGCDIAMEAVYYIACKNLR